METSTVGQVRVLFADDELDYLACQVQALRHCGLDVTGVGDGRAALELMAVHDYDVVVLDLDMPEVSGLEALREIRSRYPITPVLILSGHADLADARRALHAGAFDFLVKPCPVDALVSAVTDAAEHRTIVLDVERHASYAGRTPEHT